MVQLLAALVSTTAHAEPLSPDRPALPAYSTAGDAGPATLWRNAANLAFDPDPSYAVIYAQHISPELDDNISSVAFATNLGPLGTGISYKSGPGPDTPEWWAMSTGLGLMIDRNLAMGVAMGWNLPSGKDNFTTWDLSLSYRPLPWLGLSTALQNAGGQGTDLGAERWTGGGIALRPWDDRVMLGVDYARTDISGSTPYGLVQGTLRAEPVDGLVFRLYGDRELPEEQDYYAPTFTVGGGLEMFFGSFGAGAMGRGPVTPDQADLPVVMAYATGGDRGKRLFGGRNKVPEFVFDQAFPYQPPTGLFSSPSESYLHLLERLRKAVEDPAVAGILLRLDWTPFSYAQVEEIRAVISQARARGKPVIAYLNTESSTRAYLIACAADKVYMHPAGNLDLIGLSAELTYLRGVFDLVGVKPQFARRAEYKSAMEGYTNHESSPATREQMNAMLDSIFASMVGSIAEGRGLTEAQVRELIDGGPYTGAEAYDKGLVDALQYPDELTDRLDDAYGEDWELDDQYMVFDETSGWRANNEIAVIFVDGVIVSGPSQAPGMFGGSTSAGSETIVAQLDAARKDDAVKAVVLRVDSPGGSAFASDEIWRAAQRLREEKPVIVSMGGVAASGGYYVSAGATAIYAQPSTITGSIGVIGGKFSIEELYEKVGISYEVYNRGRNAAMFSMSKPFDDVELEALDRMIGDTYAQFKGKVEAGRGLTSVEVEEVARGRVWTGADASSRKLVDELGGFHDAIKRARSEAGLDDKKVEVVAYTGRLGPEGPVPSANLRVAVRNLASRSWHDQGGPQLPEELMLLEQWRLLSHDAVWALMPYSIELN